MFIIYMSKHILLIWHYAFRIRQKNSKKKSKQKEVFRSELLMCTPYWTRVSILCNGIVWTAQAAALSTHGCRAGWPSHSGPWGDISMVTEFPRFWMLRHGCGWFLRICKGHWLLKNLCNLYLNSKRKWCTGVWHAMALYTYFVRE